MSDIFLSAAAVAVGVSMPWLLWLMLIACIRLLDIMNSKAKIEVKKILSNNPDSWSLIKTTQPPNPQMITLHFKKARTHHEMKISVSKNRISQMFPHPYY